MNTDVMHPAGPDMEWSESYYFNFYDPGSNICCFTRIGVKPNMDERTMFLFLMLPDGSLVGMREQDALGNGDLSVKGLSYAKLEDEKRWAIRYEGPLVRMGTQEVVMASLDLEFRCLNPVYDYRDSVTAEGERIARRVASEHLEQFGRMTGSVRINGSETAISGLGERDHSWGVREWTAPKMWIWLTAEFDEGTALNVTKLLTEEGEVSAGFIHLHGRNLPIVSAEVRTTFDEQGRPSSLDLLISDKEGGVHKVTAEVMKTAQLPFPSRDGKAVSLLSENLARYRWGGKEGYGIAEFLKRQ